MYFWYKHFTNSPILTCMGIPATTLTWKGALLMKPTRMILAALLTTAAPDAWAQVPFPQTMNNQTTKGNTTTQSATYNTGSMPYSSQTNYEGMGGVPQYRTESSTPSYIGVLGEKWETDKRGRRSTFIHNGQEMSVGNGQPEHEPEHQIQITAPGLPLSVHDSLVGKKSNLP